MGVQGAAGTRRVRRGVGIACRRGVAAGGPAHRGAVEEWRGAHAWIAAAVDPRRLGLPLAQELSTYLRTLQAEPLARVLMAGMTFNELPFSGGELSLVRRMHHGGDFVIEPLPNLLFTRDSSFWIGPRVAITSLALPARGARDVADRPDLRAPSAVPRRAAGIRVAFGARRGRRRVAAGAGLWSPSAWGADDAGGRGSVGAQPVRRRSGAHRADRADRAGARSDAPGHGVHDGRRRCGGDVPEHRRLVVGVHDSPRRGGRGADRRRRPVCGGRREGDADREAAGDRDGAGPGDRRARSSGTTATTRWQWRPVWSSHTNATSKPTRGLPMRASKCCRSRRPSWAPAAAAHACMSCPAARDPL